MTGARARDHCSRQVTSSMLSQQFFSGHGQDRAGGASQLCPCKDSFDRERFEYEREYDILFTGLGFSKEDKKKPISHFPAENRQRSH